MYHTKLQERIFGVAEGSDNEEFMACCGGFYHGEITADNLCRELEQLKEHLRTAIEDCDHAITILVQEALYGNYPEFDQNYALLETRYDDLQNV